MPRLDKKSERIAFDIIGTPPNMRKQRGSPKKQKNIDKRLVFEETVRAG